MAKTLFLMLRKKPYSETSLVVAGISPDCGRLDFLAKGARRYGGRKFSEVDIFRCFTVQYRVSRSGLHTWCEADLEYDFSALARSSAAYRSACWLARFALANNMPEHGCPRFFRALLTAFERLAASGRFPSPDGDGNQDALCERAAAMVAPLLVFLAENGWLPEPEGKTWGQEIDDIAGAAEDAGRLPPLNIIRWRQVYRQVERWLRDSHCIVPKTGD